MSDTLDESRRYFAARLADAESAAHLHNEQLKVYKEYLRIVTESRTPEEYGQKLGPLASMFAVARAEQMDKYMNLMRLYHKLGNADKLEAAKLRYDTAEKAQNHGDLVNLLSSAQTEASAIDARSHQKLSLASTLIQCVIACMTEPVGEFTAGRRAAVLQTYTELLGLDPTFKWQSLNDTPYAYVVFFDAARMQRLGEIFAEIKA